MDKINRLKQLKRNFEVNHSLYEGVAENVGEKLVKLRKKLGYTQQDVADVIGITRATLSNYEKAERIVDIEIFYKLCSFYNVSLDYMVGIKRTPTPELDYDEKNQIKQLGFSEEALEILWGDHDTVEFLNDMILHQDFKQLLYLNHYSRYTRYESMDMEYRSFLTSKLLYEMTSDIYEQWYIDNDERIKTLPREEKEDLLKKIEEYKKQKEEADDLRMFDYDASEEKDYQVEMLYKKLKHYF